MQERTSSPPFSPVPYLLSDDTLLPHTHLVLTHPKGANSGREFAGYLFMTMQRATATAAALVFAISATFALEILESDESGVTARSEDALELTCSTSDPWEYCKWTFSGGACLRTEAPLQNNDAFCRIHGPEDESVRWVGTPSIDQRCSLLISDPELSRDAGQWTCQLVKDDQTAKHTYDVTVHARAAVSFVGRPYKRMQVGQSYSVECEAREGSPAPSLGAVVSASPGTDLLEEDFLLESEVENTDGMLGGTVSTVFRYEPTPSNRIMFVKCFAFQEDVYRPPSSVISEFEVVYPPLPNDEVSGVQVAYVDLGMPGEVTIEFRANPVPTNEEVIWHYVKDETDESFVLSPGEEMVEENHCIGWFRVD